MGAAALVTGVGSGGSGGGDGTARVAGGDIDAKPVAWQTATDSSEAQRRSIDQQSSHAEAREKAEAKKKADAKQRAAEARKKAEAKQRAEAARKARAKAAAAEKRRKAAAARAARAKAAAERAAKEAASRSAQRAAPAAPSGSPQQIARQIIGNEAQFQCFSQIVERESGWRADAQNPSSGAYGLVQALPGSKMASAGADWRTNPATQITWGLGYMNDRYGSPCGAWSFWQANSWY
ncbi:lytic transglycosylase domain-containing protein [Streptomyces sp. SB3404]|uniref:Lytic transglycosylase domain-containing protein n=1 Tax=Streptomyces boncukensis TaxID=2711219 RepID=A0A6G4WYA4_9ACTN|nr:lytic transglycosylase domain-containing protein [Streptomyces boncukensis]